MDYLEKVAMYEEDLIKKIATRKKDEEDDDDEYAPAKNVAAAGAVVGGTALTARQLKKGNITGRETLYHTTDKDNVKSILRDGVKAFHANDKDNTTNQNAIGKAFRQKGEKIPEYTYFGNKKIKLNTKEMKEALLDVDLKRYFKEYQRQKSIKVKAPVWKMKTAENPELMGVNHKDPMRGAKMRYRLNKAQVLGADDDIAQLTKGRFARFNPIHYSLNSAFDSLGPKHTTVIDGDMPSQYITKSKDYKRTNLREIKDFIKNNPKRFAKGAVLAAAGTAAATAGGAYLVNKYRKKKKLEKEKEEA